MGKVAVPINGTMLSDNFNNCAQILIYDITNKKLVSKLSTLPPQNSIQALNKFTSDMGITDFIVHNIEKSTLTFLADTKINLFVGVEIQPTDTLIEEYLNGTLRSNAQNLLAE